VKLLFKIIICASVVFIIAVAGGAFFLTRGLHEARDIEVMGVDMSSLEDGTYEGKYTRGRWTNEVSVTVKDNRITDIEVVKSVLFERPEVTEELLKRVVEKQDTTVDVVSGATVTSKAYLKAIEDALIK